MTSCQNNRHYLGVSFPSAIGVSVSGGGHNHFPIFLRHQINFLGKEEGVEGGKGRCPYMVIHFNVVTTKSLIKAEATSTYLWPLQIDT